MPREPIENEYFNWLCAKVLYDPRREMYYDVLGIMYRTPFVWYVIGDRNRAGDGLELRDDFLRESRSQDDPLWHEAPCSVLEMMVAFSYRASFQTDTSNKDWFWEFMTNLDLGEYRRVSQPDVPVIEEVLHTFIGRTYNPSGHGGMFPMRWPKQDQREVEIWYQFCEYLEDRGLV